MTGYFSLMRQAQEALEEKHDEALDRCRSVIKDLLIEITFTSPGKFRDATHKEDAIEDVNKATELMTQAIRLINPEWKENE